MLRPLWSFLSHIFNNIFCDPSFFVYEKNIILISCQSLLSMANSIFAQLCQAICIGSRKDFHRGDNPIKGSLFVKKICKKIFS
jgi:hypothetical protein